MATVPPYPGAWYPIAYSNVYVHGDADPRGTGGSEILQWQLAWGTSPTTPGSGGGFTNLNLSSGWGELDGLRPGTLYYFWNRQRNAIGWGAWGPRSSLTMRDIPDPPDSPSLAGLMTQTSIVLRVTPNYDGNSGIGVYRVRYGLNPTEPTNVVSSTSNLITITGLQPGALYYFWGQAGNIYGDSYYSARNYALLIAGAKLKVGSVWKRAVPYAKVAGVWRVARPWGRIAGFWNETPE